MPTRSEVLGNGAIRGEEALRMPGGLKPLHPPLPLTGGLVRILGAVVEVAVLAMCHPREDLPRRGAITVQLVRNGGRQRTVENPSRSPRPLGKPGRA